VYSDARFSLHSQARKLDWPSLVLITNAVFHCY
jgi:hypothetical protein